MSSSAITAARDKLLAQPGPNGRRRGAATSNRYLAALSHVFSTAVRDWELLDSNPVSKLRKLKEPRGRQRFLSEPEAWKLLAACNKHGGENLHDVVLLAMSTGMRRNEILSLRYKQVDVGAGMIYLVDTKNGESRGVPLAGLAQEAMTKRAANMVGSDKLLFRGKTGRTPFDIRKPWYRAVAETKLVDLRFHDLRHTAASFLAKGGASLAIIGEILGHKSAVMTKRYSHFAHAHLRTVVGAMNDSVFRSNKSC